MALSVLAAEGGYQLFELGPAERGKRDGLLDAGGAVPCGGTYAFDLSSAIAQGLWQPGETVWAQGWFRGNASQPSGAGLTNGVVFSVLP